MAKDEEAMDGSPAVVTVMLWDLIPRTLAVARMKATGVLVNEPVITIRFQRGPIGETGETGVNGCAIEDVLDVLIERLEGFERGPFTCRENRFAIMHLKSAKGWLGARTAARQAQGVEGTNQPHTS
ncbi:MAG: hypothetical protein Q8S13_13385 [Dehalococcoidia bacterium]|nr:hypothetical protein [Dehalococcoidia bacterium]